MLKTGIHRNCSDATEAHKTYEQLTCHRFFAISFREVAARSFVMIPKPSPGFGHHRAEDCNKAALSSKSGS